MLIGFLCVPREDPGKVNWLLVNSGNLVSRVANAVPHDISGPISAHSIVSWRALAIP